MKKLLIIYIILNLFTHNLYSQNRTIKGRVISEFFDTVPGVSIIINCNDEVGKTDIDGFYQIEIPVSVNELSFKFVGLETTNIEFLGQCDEIDVVMMFNVTYDFISLKKVDRLRMKRYKKLPNLHKEAFDKGIFKTDKACYTQEFVPYYQKKP